MQDKNVSIKDEEGYKLKPEDKQVGKFLDSLVRDTKLSRPKTIKPSELYFGALFLIGTKNSNPDWKAQSAHSLRDIFYYVLKNSSNQNREIKNIEKIGELFKVLHEEARVKKISEDLNKIYNAFTKISHHFVGEKDREQCLDIFKHFQISISQDFLNDNDFLELIKVFNLLIKESSLDPLGTHEKIRNFIAEKSRDFEYLNLLFNLNFDAKPYFYANIDQSWIRSLQDNNFFGVLNEKALDTTTYAYRMPELAYLTNIAESAPKEVADVILATKTTAENFNPEVIERFLWIATKLPAEQLKQVVGKMKDYQWVKLMGGFRKTGYEFAEMVETLKKASDWDGLIDLAQAIMIVREEKGDKYRDGFFYVSDISESGIFTALSEMNDPEKIQIVLLDTLSRLEAIIKNSGNKYNNSEYPFEYDDPFGLHDTDLFTIEMESNRMRSFRADENNFIALLVMLLKKVSGDYTKKIYDLLTTLPSSRLSWKLKLVFAVDHKAVFVEEVYEMMNYLFELGDNYSAIFTGPEYKQVIGKVFFGWTSEQRDVYIAKLTKFFKDQQERHPDQYWHAQNAVKILSILSASTDDKLVKDSLAEIAQTHFGISIDESYKPEPSIQSGMAGVVQHRSPFDITEFEPAKIFENLKSDWVPKKLAEEYKNDDYLKPRGAEGLGDALREDLKNRLGEYVSVMIAEENYKDIHPHYIYSLVRGLEELLRDQNKTWTKAEIDSVLKVLFNLQTQDNDVPEPEAVDGAWLGTWTWVKRSMADTLIYVIELRDKDLRKEIHNQYKEKILELINYLFDTPESPNPEEEKPEYGDPFHIAINSVRGRIYQGFVVYVENDGNTLSKESKEFFKKALGDKSVAVRFVIGHYLPSIYYRGKEFITGLLDQIFPKNQSDKLATWEGYLCSPLYKELYTELKKYYEWGIDLDPKEYYDRKYTKDLNEALASHIALAFVHFQEDHTSGLVEKFLEKKRPQQINEFITFIGRSYFTRDVANRADLEKFPGGFGKFMNFWDWVIEQKLEPESYGGFGFWMNTQIIEPKILADKIERTLKVSNGIIDWEHKFEESLETFAETDPEKTLNIIKSYLLDKEQQNLNPRRRYPLFAVEDEIKKSLEIIYKQDLLKSDVEKLVNELIEKGSQMFWELEEILK